MAGGFFDEPKCTIAILDIGGAHHGTGQQTAGISHDMALAALDFLAAVTTGPGGGIPDKPGFTAFR